jgi:hypothetical protein
MLQRSNQPAYYLGPTPDILDPKRTATTALGLALTPSTNEHIIVFDRIYNH